MGQRHVNRFITCKSMRHCAYAEHAEDDEVHEEDDKNMDPTQYHSNRLRALAELKERGHTALARECDSLHGFCALQRRGFEL